MISEVVSCQWGEEVGVRYIVHIVSILIGKNGYLVNIFCRRAQRSNYFRINGYHRGVYKGVYMGGA